VPQRDAPRGRRRGGRAGAVRATNNAAPAAHSAAQHDKTDHADELGSSSDRMSSARRYAPLGAACSSPHRLLRARRAPPRGARPAGDTASLLLIVAASALIHCGATILGVRCRQRRMNPSGRLLKATVDNPEDLRPG